MLVSKPVLCKKRVLFKCLVGLSLITMAQPAVVHAAFFTRLNIHGSLEYNYNLVKAEELQTQINSVSLNLGGSSPIWHPWFATMSAGVGLGLAASESTGIASPESSFSSNNLNLAFSVFPISRFPFQLNYSSSHNETENFSNTADGATTISTVSDTTRLGFQQAYTTRDLTHINFFYTISDYVSDFSNYKNNVGGIRVNKAYSKQRYSIDGNYVKNEQQDVKSESVNYSLSGSHSYYPSTELGITSLISSSFANSKSGFSTSELDTSLGQVSSSVSWRPRHKPYSLSGAIRFTQTEADSILSTTKTNAVGTGATLTWQFSRQTRGTFDANVTINESDGRQSLVSTQNANIGFFSTPLPIIGFFYHWNVGGAGSNSSSKLDGDPGAAIPVPDIDTSSQSLGASFGHSATKNWLFNKGNLSLSLSQTMSATKSFFDDPADLGLPAPPVPDPVVENLDEIVKSLASGINFGGSHFGFGGSTLMNAQLTDTRTFIDEGVSFQMATFSLSRNQGINRLSSASGNLYLQASRTDDPRFLGGIETAKSGSVAFAYQHVRAFGIYALVYQSTLEQESFLTSSTDKGNIEWLNTFSYAIGLLSSKLSYRIIQAPDGSQTTSFNFQATRSF